MRFLIRSSVGALVLAAAAFAADGGLRMPEAKTGPYRVVVDRISQNTNLTVNYAGPASALGQPASNVDVRRMVQLQLSVFAATKEAGMGLTTFQVSGVSVDSGGRVLQLTPYGGPLDNPSENAVLRAYLYVPVFPATVREVRALEGQIIGYERSKQMEIEIPIGDGAVPRVVQKDDIKATLREYNFDGDSAQVVVWLEAPANSSLVNTTTDGSYGMKLVDVLGRTSTPNGGAFINPRPHQAEYRLGFHSLRRAPAAVRVQLLYRGGERRTYPFRIEGIPVPGRPVPAKASPRG